MSEYCALLCNGSIPSPISDSNPPPHYAGAITDQNLEKLTDRRWSRHRSRLVDLHVVYSDAESLGGCR